MESAINTGRALRECESSYNIGLQAEEIVAEYYIERGYELLRRRWKTPFAEIDLLFSKPRTRSGELLLVEVKHRRGQEFREMALTRRQKQRLVRCCEWLSELGYLVQCELVFVGPNQKIELQTGVFE